MASFLFDMVRLNQWIALGHKARRDDPRCILPSDAVIRRQFDRAHPMWRHCQHLLFCVEGARCAAIVNPRLVEMDGTPYGQVGWFEACDREAAVQVLDEACAWLRERGCRNVLGPMNGSSWHAYRFVVDWGNEAPFLLEPNHPLDYPHWWESVGFQRMQLRYYSSTQDNREVVQSLADGRRRAEALGYSIVHVDVSELQAVLRRIFEISMAVFRNNALYSDITWEEFTALYDGIERLLEPRLVHWLIAPAGQIVGVGFGVPDHGEAVRRLRGRSGLLARARFLTAPRPLRSIFKTMGILREHQGKGLASALFHEQAVQSVALGWPIGIRALMAEDNHSFATGRQLHHVIRTYALFTRAL